MKKHFEIFKVDSLDFEDAHLQKPFKLIRASAADVSNYLKKNLTKNGIDPEYFNITRDMHEPQDPPVEIYEYQNFFLMERLDGELVLLDGFRRLLYCTPPDHTIFIRIYRESDMTHHDIMKMMVYLNHFKFHGLGPYYDRGFALLMYTLFGVDIPKIKSLFDVYMRGIDSESYYNSTEKTSGATAIDDVTERLLDPLFVDNMKFLQDMVGTGQMVNSFFAIQFRDFSAQYKKPLTKQEFLDKVKDNQVLNDLLIKYKKYGTAASADSTKVVRQIREIYATVFNSFLGVETEKTYAEWVVETKETLAKLKKDKTLTKLSKMSQYREVIRELIKRHENGETVEYVLVVHPANNFMSGSQGTRKLSAEPGVYTTTTVEIGMSGNGMSRDKNLKVFLMDGDQKRAVTVVHHGSYSSPSRVFVELEGCHSYFGAFSKAVKVDVFVRKTFK